MRVVVLICCAVALAAAAAFVYLPKGFDGALIVAVAMLACAQIVSLLATRAPREQEDAKLASLAQRITKNAADLDRLSTRWRDQSQKLAELEHRFAARSQREPAMVSLPAVPAAGATAPSQARRAAALQPEAAPPSANEPSLFLEPVVRLSEGRTAYYKASLRLAGGNGGNASEPVLSSDIAVPRGAVDGSDAVRDLKLLRDALPVLARLRTRRSAAGIFLPISVATLASRTHLEAYVAALQASPEEAAAIVLDINVSALAGLEETALRGLAWLANLGAAFCLTGRGAAQCDFAALSELGFAFVDVPLDELAEPNSRLSQSAERLMQSVTARNMTLIAAGIADQGRLAGLTPTVSLARGPAFAPPRAVRTQAEHVHSNRQVA